MKTQETYVTKRVQWRLIELLNDMKWSTHGVFAKCDKFVVLLDMPMSIYFINKQNRECNKYGYKIYKLKQLFLDDKEPK